MKAVILVAGKGVRMGDLTKDTPKPLLKIGSKTILEYKIEALPTTIDEVILVIGYLGDKVRATIGDSFAGRKITYIEAEPLGTAYALWQTAHLLKEHFIVMNGDDLYARRDIEECLKYEQSGLISKFSGGMSGGKMEIKDGLVVDILEGIYDGDGLMSTGLFVLSPVIFKYQMLKMPGREEYGIPPTIIQAVHEMPITAVYVTKWKQISAPQDIDVSPEEMAGYME
ncbi:hypothetical protein EXS61_01445 [Candidatus Parcubacteria bacterium]|nr:hypothetical protein [Candidatus Parcubacteria bacterium]